MGIMTLEKTLLDWVCISVLDWNHPTLNSTQAALAHNLAARGHRVFFVNPPLRWLTDFKQTRSYKWLRQKLTGWRKGFVPVSPNFYGFTPPPHLPQNRLPAARLYEAVSGFNRLTFLSSLRRALAPYNVQRPILWIALEPLMGAAALGKLNEQLSFYHCTDELGGFGTLSPYLLELEAEVINRSDMLIATSQNLYEAKKAFNSNSFYLPNAADVNHFKQSLAPLPEPPELAVIPSPRFGFVGQIEYRFDTELIYWVAKTRPDWHFVLIGPVQQEYVTNPPLLSLPNVHTLGPRPSAQLPAYLRHLDVTLIPYKLNKLTEGIYPLKLHEYLAAGKPVLATRLPSLLPFDDLISLVDNPEEFIRKGEEALQTAGDAAAIAQRVTIAEANSWDRRIEALLELVTQEIARKGATNSLIGTFR